MERAPLPMDVIVYIMVNDFITKLLPYNFANILFSANIIAVISYIQSPSLLPETKNQGVAINHPWKQ